MRLIEVCIHKVYALVFVVLWITGCTVMPQTSLSSTPSRQLDRLTVDVQLIPVNFKAIENLRSETVEATDARLPTESVSQWEYRVGPGDILNIVVWEHPQLTIPAGPSRGPTEAGNWVHEDGTLFYPYIGKIQVSGKTVSDIRSEITEGLKVIIPRPQVDVSVAGFRSQKVYVSGAVVKPGSLALTNVPLTLLDAVSQSGGFGVEADYRRISLIRNDVEYVVDLQRFFNEGNTKYNPRLQSQDIIRVPEFSNNDAFLLGEVGQPGTIPLRFSDVSLTHALATVGGIDNRAADARGIFIFRRQQESENIKVYQLDAKRPTAYLLGTQFVLKPSDVVYVTSAPAARWNRLVLNIIPSLSAFNTLLLLDNRL